MQSSLYSHRWSIYTRNWSWILTQESKISLPISLYKPHLTVYKENQLINVLNILLIWLINELLPGSLYWSPGRSIYISHLLSSFFWFLALLGFSSVLEEILKVNTLTPDRLFLGSTGYYFLSETFLYFFALYLSRWMVLPLCLDYNETKLNRSVYIGQFELTIQGY